MINTFKTTLFIILISIITIFSNFNNIKSSKVDLINDYSYNNVNLSDTSLISTDTIRYIELDTSSIIIDNNFTEMILNSFIQDAFKNGLDSAEVKKHIKKLDAIIIADLSEEDNLGLTAFKPDSLSPTGLRGLILIDYNLLNNYDLYMFTLYHELGHWFSLPHCDCENSIMIAEYNKESTYEVLANWDKYVKKLMRDIKKTHKKNSKFIYPDSSIATRANYHNCNHNH